MDKLKFINEQMNKVLEIPYEFMEWTSVVKYPYYVGEITEEETTTEDGHERSVLLLSGFHRGKYIDLLEDCAKIKKYFDPVYGLRSKTETGSIAVFYAGSSYIPTGESELKRIQINLKIEEWKGAI